MNQPQKHSPQKSSREFESDGRNAADPDGNAEHSRLVKKQQHSSAAGLPQEPNPSPVHGDGMPDERSSDGLPATEAGDTGSGYQNRGAVGYASPSENVQQEVCEALLRTDALEVSEIEVLVSDEGVILLGEVPSHEQKQKAEAAAQQAAKGRSVKNELSVRFAKTI